MEGYEAYDGLGLAALVRQGEVSPEMLLEAAIARIEAHDATLNAVVIPMFDEARAAIRRGLPQGPFRGAPFLLKDLDIAAMPGAPMPQGSALFRDVTPDYEATLVTRYRQAGLVFVGRTASPEFGLATTTASRLFGVTRNPWDPQCSPGGSSGGAAAAVAAGYTPMANASDGGGSIRLPASWCGVFGFKPTRVRNPVGPAHGLGWAGLECAHAITRSVRDSAALLDVTQGADLGAPFVAPPPVRPYLHEVDRPPGCLRLALRSTPFTYGGVSLHSDCRAALEDAVQLCTELGHIVEPLCFELDWEPLRDANRLVAATEIRCILEQRAKELGRELRETDVEPETWRLAEISRAAQATDYLRALNLLHATGRAFAAAMHDYDAIITPTAPMPPVRLDCMSSTSPEGVTARRAAISFTQIANIAGNPAMSAPLYWNRAGMPIGIQFIGRYGDEATLFRLAGQLEAARPWRHRRPVLKTKAYPTRHRITGEPR